MYKTYRQICDSCGAFFEVEIDPDVIPNYDEQHICPTCITPVTDWEQTYDEWWWNNE